MNAEMPTDVAAWLKTKGPNVPRWHLLPPWPFQWPEEEGFNSAAAAAAGIESWNQHGINMESTYFNLGWCFFIHNN